MKSKQARKERKGTALCRSTNVLLLLLLLLLLENKGK